MDGREEWKKFSSPYILFKDFAFPPLPPRRRRPRQKPTEAEDCWQGRREGECEERTTREGERGFACFLWRVSGISRLGEQYCTQKSSPPPWRVL